MARFRGRYVGVEEYERLEAREAADLADFVAERKEAQQRKPGFDPERLKQIRAYYARQIGSQFGPTSFDVGGGLTDQGAFDACVESYGFVPAVVALKLVSTRARSCAAAYEARKKREAGARRAS